MKKTGEKKIMKKVTATLLISMLMLAFSVTNIGAADVWGDVNGDGTVAITDLVRLAQYLASWDIDLCLHNSVTHIEATEPTCTADGNIECYVCNSCGVFSKNTEMTDRISEEDIIIYAPGHDYVGEEDLDPTCTEDGHSWYHYCDRCGKVFQEKEIFEAYGHTTDYETGKCRDCGIDMDFKATQGLELTYVEEWDSYTVSGIGTATDTDIVLPGEYNGKWVGDMEVEAFMNCTNITSVRIPDTFGYIPEGAFANCTSLTDVYLPETIGGIDVGAFYKCTSLKNINLSDNLTYIGTGAFLGCSTLSDMEIPDSLDDISFNAFKDTGLIRTVDGLSYAGKYLVACDNSVTEAKIANGTLGIAGEAFAGNENLISVEIPNTVKSIGWAAFENCTSLEHVEIPDSVVKVHGFSFGNTKVNCEEENGIIYYGNWVVGTNNDAVITSAVIREGTVGIARGSFVKCYELETLVIPDSVKHVGWDFNFSHLEALKSVYIGGGVGEIGSGAFEGCTALRTVYLGNGITKIDDYAFDGCTSLVNITFPESLTYIGHNALSCTAITSLYLKNGNVTIIDWAFSECEKLTSVSIGDGDKVIHYGAFAGCTSLEKVNLGYGEAILCEEAFPYCHALTEVNIEGSVCLLYHAFVGCNSLKTVNIGDGNSVFSAEAFTDCTSLTEVNVGNGDSIFWSRAFAGCNSLKAVSIGDGRSMIYWEAFIDCTALESVSIGYGDSFIADDAFLRCGSLSEIYFNGTVYEWWTVVDKQWSWDNEVGSYTIYCTDGEITKE